MTYLSCGNVWLNTRRMMRLRFILAVIGSMAFGTVIWCIAVTKSPRRAPAQTYAMGLKTIKLPFGLTAADMPYVGRWTDFYEAMGLNGQSSLGQTGVIDPLVSFNQTRFAASPCFRKLSTYFYEEIQRRDILSFAKRPNASKPLRRRATLADTAGRGDYVDQQPGWAWDLALKITGGDRTLAMQILGVCGHDDSIGERMTGVELNTGVEAERKAFLERYTWSRCDTQDNECYQMFQHHRERGCPSRYSLLYLPRSLANSTDIPADLKLKIALTQAPTKGASVLPAKYYHVIGSAFTSCLALERCPDGILCPLAFGVGYERAVNIYRASRLCGQTIAREASSGYGYRALLEKKFGEYSTWCGSTQAFETLEAKIRAVGRRDCGDWPTEACGKALQKLETFKADFEWSRAAHAAGRKFAEANCPRLAENADPLVGACSALTKYEGTLTRAADAEASPGGAAR